MQEKEIDEIMDSIETEDYSALKIKLKDVDETILLEVLDRCRKGNCFSNNPELFEILNDSWQENSIFEDLIILALEQNLLSPKLKEMDSDISEYPFFDRLIHFIRERLDDEKEPSFHNPHLDQIKKVIIYLARTVPSKDDFLTGDPIGFIFSAPLGLVCSALINFVIRQDREYKKKNSAFQWDPEIKALFDDYLKNNVPELEITVAYQMYNLGCIDSQWLHTNLNHILPIDDEPRWKRNFKAYLYYMSAFASELVQRLITYGHYTKAVQTTFEYPYGNYLMYHISIIFIYGYDASLEDKNCLIRIFFGKIKDDKDKRYPFIQFFRKHRKEFSSPMKIKVHELWCFLCEEFLRDSNSYRQLLSQIALWITIFNRFDKDTMDLFKRLIPFVERIDASIILKYLAEEAKIDDTEVGEILSTFALNKIVISKIALDAVEIIKRKHNLTSMIDTIDMVSDFSIKQLL